jgi:hypothetical protein
MNEAEDIKSIKSRRVFLKSSVLLVIGGSVSVVSTNAKADPIKLVIDAMSMAAKYVLDMAIDMVEGMLDGLLDGFMSNDGEKVAKVGDGLNQVKHDIFDRNIQLDTMPAPRNCELANKDKVASVRRRNDQVLHEALNSSASKVANNSVADVLLGRDHDYGRTFLNYARERGLSVGSAGANSNKISFNIGGLIRDGVKFANEEDKKNYLDTYEVMKGSNTVPEVRPSEIGTVSGLTRKLIHKQESRIAVTAIADGNFMSDYRLAESGKYEALRDEISATYHSIEWRKETTNIASPVPNAINLINLTSTRLEILFELMLQLDKTILLKSAKVARGHLSD